MIRIITYSINHIQPNPFFCDFCDFCVTKDNCRIQSIPFFCDFCDFCVTNDNCRITRSTDGCVTSYDFPVGYATPKQSYAVFDMDFHFYVQDHLGSNVMVLDQNGIEQQTRYYPFGGIVTHNSTNPDANHNKYTGKEFDRMHGLDWYDYVARQYDPVYGRFTSIDPLCEKYPYLSPYAYCGNNPMNAIDPDGRDYWVIKDEREKRITIKANYYAMKSDMKELNKALEFWNGLTYEINGYNVSFELSAIEIPDGDYENNAKEQFVSTQYMIIQSVKIKNGEEYRHDNIFLTGFIEDPNENGHTKGQIITIKNELNENLMTGEHEVGHSLGLVHSFSGLMTPDSNNKRRSRYISKSQIRQIINNAKNGVVPTDENNDITVGIGYYSLIK